LSGTLFGLVAVTFFAFFGGPNDFRVSLVRHWRTVFSKTASPAYAPASASILFPGFFGLPQGGVIPWVHSLCSAPPRRKGVAQRWRSLILLSLIWLRICQQAKGVCCESLHRLGSA
jgi:hypothetical protein